MSMGEFEPTPDGWGRGCSPIALQLVANIKSQKKRILTNAKAADRNKAVKSELKTRIRTATDKAGTPEGEESLRAAVKRIDKAAAKGIIHPNSAARRKSRLMKRLNLAAK
jgi:small subunit ribosomal protein S20